MIEEFRDKYFFLSNFYMSIVHYEGISYKSSEHAFQAAKTFNQEARLEIAHLGTCREAKAKGRQVNMREDWEEAKDQVMVDILRIKFAKNPLRKMLLDTKEEPLMEGNYHGDRIWGCVKENGIWVGQNRLGKALMVVRQELYLEDLIARF